MVKAFPKKEHEPFGLILKLSEPACLDRGSLF